jgi:phospholipase/carboxylesterase
MPRHTLTEPVVAWGGGADHPDRPLVVLLHGRGADERSILGLAEHLPQRLSYAAVRAPLGEGGGYAWFDNRGIGRPIAASLAETVAWFTAWLDEVAPEGREVALVGFSGGAAFAGGVLLTHPERLAGAAVLHGTLPFEDAGMDVSPGRLAGAHVFVARGDADHVIPRELLDRTWTWLTEESSATVTTRRDPGGHALSAQTVHDLQEWLDARLA